MNIIKMGEMYRIFGDGITVGHELEPVSYEVGFSQMEGFFLTQLQMPEVPSGKIYGCMPERIDKVLRSFKATDRNLGVILSGAKGIGKSLFAKLVSLRAMKEGLPVVMVNSYVPGLPQFLASIEQRCMVLFDEFDKNFFNASTETENHTQVQDEFLTLFDGVYRSNKLFVITANDLNKLSEFYINRPGRFRYHLRFAYPDEGEVREYLVDRLGKAAKKAEVDEVVRFASIVPLSYDCLSAIATELELGETFESSLEILNILNVTGSRYYSGYVAFESGEEVKVDYVGSRNFFDRNEDSAMLRLEVGAYAGREYRNLGVVTLRQGEVRRRGHFLQDGSIELPIDGKAVVFAKNRKLKASKKDEAYAKPVKLTLRTSSENSVITYSGMI